MDILYIVQAAKDYDAIGILANDSDFLIYQTGMYCNMSCNPCFSLQWYKLRNTTTYTDLLKGGKKFFFIPLGLPHNMIIMKLKMH